MRILSLNVWGGMLHAPLLDYLAAVDVFVSSHVKLRPVILLAGRPARRINAIAPTNEMHRQLQAARAE